MPASKSRRSNAPQDITIGVLVAGVLGFVVAEWLGYPGVPLLWLGVVFASWMIPSPPLTGKRDSYGYAVAANPAEERKLARYQAMTSLRMALFLPARDLLPGRKVQAAWISSVLVAGLAYLVPVIGNEHLHIPAGRAINAVFGFVLSAAATGAFRRAKGGDNPGVRFNTFGAFVTSRKILCVVAPLVGAGIGLAVGYALLQADTLYGPLFGATSLTVTKQHPGLIIADPATFVLLTGGLGAWLLLLATWRSVAMAGFTEITNARAQWKYRWMSLKYDPTPALVKHEVLGNGAAIVDTFDAPGHLGAIEFQKNEIKLAPLVGAGERVAILSSPEEGPMGPIPGARSAVRFLAVTWPMPYDPSSPDADDAIVALWLQSGLAWVSHARGVAQEPLLNELVDASRPVGSPPETGTAPQTATTPTEAHASSKFVEFMRRVRDAGPTTSTLAEALRESAPANDPSPIASTSDDDQSDAAPTVVTDETRARLWRSTWYYTDDTMSPQTFRDVALAEATTAMRADVLIDHRDGGTIYVGDLDNDAIEDETTAKALEKVRIEDLWRQVWTSSVKTGANLPIPQVNTHVEKPLANGAIVHRMAFALNSGNEPLEYKYAGVESKLKSALGLGRTAGATMAAVVGFPDQKGGGRPGDRHPQAISVLWSFDRVPKTPTALAPRSPADQWVLAGIVNDTFSTLKLPHPELVSARCLTKPDERAHVWEIALRLYGGVTTGDVRKSAGKIAENLATPWVRVTDAPDGCILYCGVEPVDDILASPDDVALVASLDWEDAFLVSHVVGAVGSVPRLVSVDHLPSNESVSVLEFELPPGLDKTTMKIALAKLRTATGNKYLNILDSENGPTFITVQASVDDPLPDLATFDFAAADRATGMAFATGVDGEPVEFEPRRDVHVAIIGMTGSGKSVAAQAVLYGAAIKGYELYVVDPVKYAADFKFLEPYARVMATDVHSAAATLKAVYEEVIRRKDVNGRYGVASIADLPDDLRPAPMLVFIDEFTSLITTEKVPSRPFEDPALELGRREQLRVNVDRATIAQLTGRLAREARSAGVVLALGTQKLMAKSLENVPGGGDLKANLSRVLLGSTSQGDRMSALRAFDQAPDPGEIIPQGRGIFESAVRTGVLVQGWYAPASVLAEELAKRVALLSPDQMLDVTSYLSPEAGPTLGLDGPYLLDDDEEDSDHVIDLGEVSFSLDDLAATDDEPEPTVRITTLPQPESWDIDWSSPSTAAPLDDDPFVTPAALAPKPRRMVNDDDPFA